MTNVQAIEWRNYKFTWRKKCRARVAISRFDWYNSHTNKLLYCTYLVHVQRVSNREYNSNYYFQYFVRKVMSCRVLMFSFSAMFSSCIALNENASTLNVTANRSLTSITHAHQTLTPITQSIKTTMLHVPCSLFSRLIHSFILKFEWPMNQKSIRKTGNMTSRSSSSVKFKV